MGNSTAVEAFIEEVASKPGNDDPSALWPCILINAFTSANHGQLAPLVYTRALAPHANNPSARKLILRCVKESLLKGTMIFGLPRALNAFYALSKLFTDEDSNDSESNVRMEVKNPFDKEVLERGMKYFENVYRSDAGAILGPLKRFFPEMRVLAVDLEYGLYLSDTSILSPIETSVTTVASLVPLDVPTQVKWHMRGLLRNGGTPDQVKEVLRLSDEVCRLVGVELRGGLPGLEELSEKLF